jgi:hypothetical protein
LGGHRWGSLRWPSGSKVLAKASRVDALKSMARFKFDQIGFDPLIDDRRLNFIEQINQTFTVLASLKAARDAFSIKTVKSIRLNLGPHKGFDMEFLDSKGSLIGVGEVFAAVKPSNNQKSNRDLSRLSASTMKIRRLYFVSPMKGEFSIKRQKSLNGEMTTEDGIFVKHLRDAY